MPFDPTVHVMSPVAAFILMLFCIRSTLLTCVCDGLQYTRVQRVVVLCAVFLTSLAVVALLFGRRSSQLQGRLVAALLAACAMFPCRTLLPMAFRAANTLPALPLWPRPSMAAIASMVLAKLRSANRKRGDKRGLLSVSIDTRVLPTVQHFSQPHQPAATPDCRRTAVRVSMSPSVIRSLAQPAQPAQADSLKLDGGYANCVSVLL